MTSTADLVTDSVADLNAKNEKSFKEMKFKEKVSYIREVITVEPIIGSYVMASTLCTPTIFNLEFEKSCRSNLEFNDTVCEAVLSGQVENITEQNNEIQVLINNMHSWQLPMQSVMPLILILFLGSYSDRHRWRKPFLIMPLFGEMISITGLMLCVIFMKPWTLEVQGVFQLVIPSFFGGQPMITMAVFAYIADVSTIEMRTLRIGIVQIVIAAIVPATQLIAAHMFELTGYFGVFLTAGGLYIFGFLYGLYWIKEPHEPIKTSEVGMLRDMFNPKHAIDTFNLVLKKTPGVNREYIMLMLLIVFIYSAVVDGEGGVFFLYAQSQFGWTIIEFSYFLTLNTLVHLIGTALAVPLFTKVLHLTDMIILFLTFFDKIVSNIIFGLANTNVLLYTGAIVSLITGVTPIGIRSLETKIVSENDLGKAQSLFGICEALAPAVATPIYSKLIYNNTLTTFPAMYFFFGIFLYAIASMIIISIYLREKRRNTVEPSPEKQLETNGKQAVPMEHFVETTHI
ncbi:unnamed protein product [Psylliodes chrysocephalus]|uniref:Proton-coupled folate transporter n=1 Tax=Psylliodes chrysocephalus TaxID=3402493 RepID=A0A9P0CH30_9CUCU|nr:unnamed protein product [Psylliodes chrysocephala]